MTRLDKPLAELHGQLRARLAEQGWAPLWSLFYLGFLFMNYNVQSRWLLATFATLLLFLPLLLLVMVAIQVESPGPAIFRQRRTGYRGRVFTILKFRTMTVAEDNDQVRQATRNDERVTAVGALLRKLSIDELPQLWNVLRGEMSLVGPRPLVPSENDHVMGWHRSRLDLTPQSPGLYALSLGLSKRFADDHEMLEHGLVMYDALYAWCKDCQEEAHNWPPKM